MSHTNRYQPLPADGPFVLLDNSSGHGAPSLLFTQLEGCVTAEKPGQVAGAIRRLERARQDGLHAAGFFGYELGYLLEPRLVHLLPRHRTVPLLWFGLFKAPEALAEADVIRWLDQKAQGQRFRLSPAVPAWDERAYVERFQVVQRNIEAGDIYQLNLTFKARFGLEGSPLALYGALRQRQPVAYGGIVDTGALTVLSASPELFVAEHDRVITTRPMKGTAPRGTDAAADEQAKATLREDEKQRAENLMIVDLMRNDLGRIAEIGSVSVTDLFTVETYKTLHQMTSGIRARILPDVSLRRLLEAIFPPGSVTGAPKIRAMELIAALETEPRGVYCGAIGVLSPGGESQFNVAIRSPVIGRDGRGEIGIGSGVVADSIGESEYAECLLKLKFLADAARFPAD